MRVRIIIVFIKNFNIVRLAIPASEYHCESVIKLDAIPSECGIVSTSLCYLFVKYVCDVVGVHDVIVMCWLIIFDMQIYYKKYNPQINFIFFDISRAIFVAFAINYYIRSIFNTIYYEFSIKESYV